MPINNVNTDISLSCSFSVCARFVCVMLFVYSFLKSFDLFFQRPMTDLFRQTYN